MVLATLILLAFVTWKTLPGFKQKLAKTNVVFLKSNSFQSVFPKVVFECFVSFAEFVGYIVIESEGGVSDIENPELDIQSIFPVESKNLSDDLNHKSTTQSD